MINIILCEGESDTILLSYLLINQSNWNYTNRPPHGYNIKVNTKKCESINWYKRDNDFLLMIGVGGKNRFKDFYKEKIVPIINYNENNYKLIYIVDADTDTQMDINNQLKYDLYNLIFSDKELNNDEWYDAKYTNSFKETKTIQLLFLIIPPNKVGAMETSLLDAVSQNENYKLIIDDSKKFVLSLVNKNVESIKKPRMQLKASLGVSFSIISPQKVFTTLNEIISSVNWENYKLILELYDKLIKI